MPRSNFLWEVSFCSSDESLGHPTKSFPRKGLSYAIQGRAHAPTASRSRSGSQGPKIGRICLTPKGYSLRPIPSRFTSR